MASVTVVLRNKDNKDGKRNLYLRVIKDRKISQISIGHSIFEAEWDSIKQRVKKSHNNSAWLNNLIAKKVADATDRLIEFEKNDADVTSKAIVKSFGKNKLSSFFTHSTVYIKELEQGGKFNQKSADEPRITRFKEFVDGGDISFKEITPSLLRKYRAWLKSTRQISERTIVNHLVVIRTIYNRAIEAKAADKANYPFGKGKTKIKFPDSMKIGLTKEEVKALEEIDLPSGENHARNLWLFSYYFAGMRASDVLRLKRSDFQNDRLFYAMGKNRKVDSLKVPEKALKIMLQYPIGNNHDLLFPDLASHKTLADELVVQRHIKTRIRSCDHYLRSVAEKLGMTKKLTMHIARHTFGNISGDKIPVQMLQKLYRHTHITTTIGYQANFIHKSADEALDAVLAD
ncbi:phage integrase SAM-like domain-containing protein [Dyadobacter jiangsuensis]